MLGILIFIMGLVIVAIILISLSKLTNTNVNYRGATIIESDDFDKIVDKSRKLVDTKYKNHKLVLEAYEKEVKPIKDRFNMIIWLQVDKKRQLQRLNGNLTDAEIKAEVDKIGKNEISNLFNEEWKIREKYLKLTNKPIKQFGSL
jgi:hypothetical protein